MNGGIFKSRARHSRVKLSKSLQEALLDAVADTGGGAHGPFWRSQRLANSSGTELPSVHRRISSVGGDLARDTVLVETSKRHREATTELDPLPAKRARLTPADTQQPRVDNKRADQVNKTTLQHPKPSSTKRVHASFLRDFVDPIHLNTRSASVHTSVSNWLESVGSDPVSRCRSDSYLCRSNDDIISRQVTKSAPEMGHVRDADGFVVPPTPASTGSWSYRTDADARSVAPSDLTGATPSSGRSGRSLVEDPLYRETNLAANNIYMCHPCDPIPEDVASIVDYVRRNRDSPGPSLDEIRQNRDLYDLSLGTAEPDVEKYFNSHIFHDPKSSDSLKRSDRQPMARHTVPNSGSKLKVSNPVPGMIYGYTRNGAFTRAQQTQFNSMGNTMVANSQNMICPFFVIEFKGDGPSGTGSLWVATNQCLGGSASCVNISERLNRQLRHCKSAEIQPVNTAAFSVAMSGTEARLYISWKHNELDYYMANVESFLLQRPDHFLEFRKYIRNIIDWGKDRRLKDIQNCLDSLLEESRMRSSEAAKSRLPPSDSSATSSGKRRKSSSSRRTGSRSSSGISNNVPAQEGGRDKPYWEWDETTGNWFHANANGTLTWAEQAGQSSSAGVEY
ncbi:hypothetical protein J3459_012472 [Metarhizium acridum]|nr:hypothetical protein J3459_012472 [Metarhizium acridum]